MDTGIINIIMVLMYIAAILAFGRMVIGIPEGFAGINHESRKTTVYIEDNVMPAKVGLARMANPTLAGMNLFQALIIQ